MATPNPIPFAWWLRAQVGRRGPVGEIARLVRAEIEAGCLESVPATPHELIDHAVAWHEPIPEPAELCLNYTVAAYEAAVAGKPEPSLRGKPWLRVVRDCDDT